MDALDSEAAVAHWENLDPRLDVLLSGQVEHLEDLLLAANVRAA